MTREIPEMSAVKSFHHCRKAMEGQLVSGLS